MDLAPDGKKPERQMRAAAARLKGDLQQGKDIETVQVFVLKLPDAAAHQFHVTEGEVKCTYVLFSSKLKHKIMCRKAICDHWPKLYEPEISSKETCAPDPPLVILCVSSKCRCDIHTFQDASEV